MKLGLKSYKRKIKSHFYPRAFLRVCMWGAKCPPADGCLHPPSLHAKETARAHWVSRTPHNPAEKPQQNSFHLCQFAS